MVSETWKQYTKILPNSKLETILQANKIPYSVVYDEDDADVLVIENIHDALELDNDYDNYSMCLVSYVVFTYLVLNKYPFVGNVKVIKIGNCKITHNLNIFLDAFSGN